MIINYLDMELDGDSWEELCDKCYRIRYQAAHFQKIPANHLGDCGIEGFTQDGVVYQCYCPEKDYSDDELYNHQRDKVTSDIGKLCLRENAKRLIKIGVPPVKEWHFVTPEYRDKRILEHVQAKQKEVIEKKQDAPDLFDHIDEGFRIIVKVADDFKPEIARTIRQPISDCKIRLAAKSEVALSWKDCPSEKVSNIRRKIEAVMKRADDDKVNLLVDMYLQYYMNGIEKLRVLQREFPDIYEEVFALEQACKADAMIVTIMNPDSDKNREVFLAVLNEFEGYLRNNFSEYFSDPSILDLKHDMVASWLADCSMEFSKD